MREEAIKPFVFDHGRSLIAKTVSRHPESHMTQGQERRQLKRRKVSIPALILEAKPEIREFSTGTILDYSSRGIRFTVQKEGRKLINTISNINELSVIFTVPDIRQPIIMKCRLTSISDSEREVQVGAVSVVTDMLNYMNWQQHLH